MSTPEVMPTASSTGTPSAPAASPQSPQTRRRAWVVEHDILTERGWREGYYALKPCRWLGRLLPELEALNTALARLEANSFSLLGGQAGFAEAAQGLYQDLADYRATTRRLTRRITGLALGRVGPRAPATTPDTADRPTPADEATALQAPSLTEVRTPRAPESH
jgi:hypothetical protein